MTTDNPFELASWTLAQTLAWIIYRTPEAVSQTPCCKDVYDVANDAARREGVDEAIISADLRKRFDLLEHLKRGTLAAYGVGRGQNEHNAIPTTSWHTIDSFYSYNGKRDIGPRDVGSSDESSPGYRDVFVLPNDVLCFWPPDEMTPDVERLATSSESAKHGDVPAAAETAGSASASDTGGVSATARALANSYFDEPRWPLRHALNWIAFRKVEALTLTPEEQRSLRGQAVLYKDNTAGLVSKKPRYELLTALKAGKLKAIGPDHKELPPEFWDGKSFNPRTWPEVRFRREDILRDWPGAEATAKDERAQESPPRREGKRSDALIAVPHQELVAFYRDRFGAPNAVTNREDMDRAAEGHFGGRIRVKARAAARKEAGVKGRVGRPRKSGKQN